MDKKIEQFEMVKVKRSTIKEADYNPRYITDEARKRLKQGMQKFGLVQPLIVNKKTMTVVSGHQRLSIMDDEYHYPKNDYELTVAMIDVDLKQEKALNVQLNNTSMMGEFDIDLLNEMALEGIDINDFGFSEADMDIIFSQNSDLMKLYEDSEEVKEDKDILDDIKKDRQQMVEKQKTENSAGFYFIVVCDGIEEKEKLLKQMGVPVYEEYIGSEKLKLLKG